MRAKASDSVDSLPQTTRIWMEVNLRRTHRRVPEQLGDLVKLGTSINQIAAKGMPQLDAA